MNVKIISDSGCDLPESIIEEYGIDILPIILNKDNEEFLDRVNISPEKLYTDMRNGEMYKTAQIPPQAFNEKFREYAESGDTVIYLGLSSGISGTYQSSVFVRDSVKEEYPDFDISVVDTKAASGGFGLIVYHAAKLAKEGKSKKEILKAIDFFVDHIEQVFTVDNIEYLFKGGRVTRTQAFVGGLLNIKPVLHVDELGKLVPIEKVRGKNKVYKKMVEIMEERTKNADLKDQLICITHGDDLEGATKLSDMIKEKFGAENFLINTIGAAIGAHSGPGTIALFFLNENYKG